MRSTRKIVVFGAVAAMGLASATRAASHTVNQVSLTFSPQDITIDLGDTVTWQHSSGTHTVTEGIGPGPCVGCAFDSPLTAGNPTYSVTFDATFLAANPRVGNVYDYYCQPHHGLGMIGSVTVLVPQAPVPTLTIAGAATLSALLAGTGLLAIRRRSRRKA
jgi:plastocyanin